MNCIHKKRDDEYKRYIHALLKSHLPSGFAVAEYKQTSPNKQNI